MIITQLVISVNKFTLSLSHARGPSLAGRCPGLQGCKSRKDIVEKTVREEKDRSAFDRSKKAIPL